MTGAASAVGGPIVSKDAAERVVTAPVLIPDEPDRERHWYSQKNIEEIATGFLPGGGGVDAMHLGGESGYPIESYLAPQELEFGQRTVPEGSWVVSMRVTDDEVWRGIEAGDYQGVSVEGPVAAVYGDDGDELPLDEVAVSPGSGTDRPPEPALANALGGGDLILPPAPVGETWQVELASADFVSIVDDPAVQKATFLVAKRSKSGGAGGEGNDNNEELIMDDETEEKFEELTTLVEKSVEASEGAQESAEAATETANEALEAAEGTDADGGSDGGDDGGSDPDVSEQIEAAVDDAVDDLRSDLEEADVLEGDGDGNDLDDLDVDDDTLEKLVDAGVVDEDLLDGDDGDGTSIEKRVATLEKSLQNGAGRRGSASQTEGGDGPQISSGRGGVSSAIASAGAGGEGGDDE